MRPENQMIFRRKAWEAYIGKQEQAVLPRFVTPPVFLCYWILFVLLGGAAITAWHIDVPIYVSGSGVLQEQSVSSTTGRHKMTALIFLTINAPAIIQKGVLIHLQVGKGGPNGNGQVEHIEPNLTSPQDVRRRYHLNATAASLITEPVIVVLASVAPSLADPRYEGSFMSARVPVGTQHLLMWLFEANN